MTDEPAEAIKEELTSVFTVTTQGGEATLTPTQMVDAVNTGQKLVEIIYHYFHHHGSQSCPESIYAACREFEARVNIR